MKRLFALVGLFGCVDPSPYAAPPTITTEVDDWRDEIIYQLMVDRFANGDVNNDFNVNNQPDVLNRYVGGDYQGVIDNADYLEALGVTAVWVSPIVANVEVDAGVSSYHGYWTQDFSSVNPHFGSISDFRRMVDELHSRDIKVILDIVTNHVGQLFYYDINRNGQPDTTTYGSGSVDDPLRIVSEWDPAFDAEGIQAWTSLGASGPAPLGWVNMPEINRIPPEPAVFHNDDWYNRSGRVTDWNDLNQVAKGDFPGGLKDLDTTNPEVVDALITVFGDWIANTNIDGFRIDTVKHVEHSFWQQFAPAMRERAADLGKENFLMFGEVFDGNDELLGSYTYDQELDSVFYFSQKFQVFDDVFKYGGPTSKVEDLYEQRQLNYASEAPDGGIGIPPQQALVNFLDNHDVPRFLYDQPDERALQAATTYLMTTDGIPCIYYGTEQGFNGGNDPSNREPLEWSGMSTDGALFSHLSTLSKLRKAYEPLRRGTFQIRWSSDRVADEEDAHVLAFEREGADFSVLVVINTADHGLGHTRFEDSDMPVSFDPGTTLKVVFPIGDDREFEVESDGTLRIEVDAWESLVLVPADRVAAL